MDEELEMSQDDIRCDYIGNYQKDTNQRTRVYGINGLSPCIICSGHGGREPKIWINDEDELKENVAMSTKNKEDKIKKNFTYASAFAGIGGMTLGLKELGGKGLVAWEYDPTEKKTQYAQNAHKLLHPDIPVEGNICDVIAEDVPNMDLFCFTPPCQSFSVAGDRKGFEDTRGTLTFDALRIAKVKQPKVLFMENVKGMISHDKGNTLSVILHAINEIGYTVDYTILNSKYFGVAQNRERLYLVAVRNDLIEQENWIDTAGTKVLPKSKRKYQDEGVRSFNFDWPKEEEVSVKLRDFLTKDVAEKYYLSEDKTAALVAKLSEENKNNFNDPSTTRIVQLNGDRDSPGLSSNEESAYCIPANPMSDRGQMLQEVDLISKDNPVILDTRQSTADTKDGKSGIRVSNDVCPTISATDYKEPKKVMVYSNDGEDKEKKTIEEVIPTLTPERLEKRQNGRRFKENDEEAHTITTQDRHGVTIGNGKKYRIRKLTPEECLKLQAVPQWAINILQENFSDSRLYKFAGNGLTTTVIEEIGERLLRYL